MDNQTKYVPREADDLEVPTMNELVEMLTHAMNGNQDAVRDLYLEAMLGIGPRNKNANRSSTANKQGQNADVQLCAYRVMRSGIPHNSRNFASAVTTKMGFMKSEITVAGVRKILKDDVMQMLLARYADSLRKKPL